MYFYSYRKSKFFQLKKYITMQLCPLTRTVTFQKWNYYVKQNSMEPTG